jgi:hypothetical protein
VTELVWEVNAKSLFFSCYKGKNAPLQRERVASTKSLLRAGKLKLKKSSKRNFDEKGGKKEKHQI